MPLLQKNLEVENSVEFGMFIEDDQDDSFQSHRSPFSTLRGELKLGQAQSHISHEDILANWDSDAFPEEGKETSKENGEKKPDVTSLQDHELEVKGRTES